MSYLPFGVKPIHPVRYWAKVKRNVRDVEAGATLPPILCDKDVLLAGTHRFVANELLERRRRTNNRIPVMQLSELPRALGADILYHAERGDYWLAQEVFHNYLSERLSYPIRRTVYFPKEVRRSEPVRSWLKVRRFVRDTESGDNIPPILIRDGELLTGVHRWVANLILERRGRAQRIEVLDFWRLPPSLRTCLVECYDNDDLHELQEIFEDCWWDEEDGIPCSFIDLGEGWLDDIPHYNECLP